jgi:ribosomal 30S subunit maturation factor RimM
MRYGFIEDFAPSNRFTSTSHNTNRQRIQMTSNNKRIQDFRNFDITRDERFKNLFPDINRDLKRYRPTNKNNKKISVLQKSINEIQKEQEIRNKISRSLKYKPKDIEKKEFYYLDYFTVDGCLSRYTRDCKF